MFIALIYPFILCFESFSIHFEYCCDSHSYYGKDYSYCDFVIMLSEDYFEYYFILFRLCHLCFAHSIFFL